ncbi:hypothetical protein AJ87_44790 [Rhizobium yanglingense]|nr:hypothetical protein AJ87_44790 [Rhizobium yanglingense]
MQQLSDARENPPAVPMSGRHRRGRSSKTAVLIAERRSRVLGDHEAGIAAGITGKERRKTAYQRIDKPINSPLAQAAFDEAVLALRPSRGIATVGASIRNRLSGSGLVAAALARRTQDALSLRAIPHAHGGARDVFEQSAETVDRELASVTDNPAISGTPDNPIVSSEAQCKRKVCLSGRFHRCNGQ